MTDAEASMKAMIDGLDLPEPSGEQFNVFLLSEVENAEDAEWWADACTGELASTYGVDAVYYLDAPGTAKGT